MAFLMSDVLAAVPPIVVLIVMALNLWTRDKTLRGLLKDVKGELDEARKERAEARAETQAERAVADELRLEVGRLRRAVSKLVKVIQDAGLPVPEDVEDAA